MLSIRRHQALVVVSVGLSALVLLAHRVAVELGVAFGRTVAYFGTPIEYWGLLWSATILGLWAHRRAMTPDAQARLTVYDWWWSVIGLAGVAFVGQALGISRLQEIGIAYAPLALAVASVFVGSCLVDRSVSAVGTNLALREATGFFTRPLTWLLVAAAVIGIVWGPRSADRPEAGAGFDRWYSTLTALPMPDELRTRSITLVEFVDYQCPACRARFLDYEPMLNRLSAELGDQFVHRRLDFPLDSECNKGGMNAGSANLHDAACEAAVAVRIAKQHGREKEREVIGWLWDHQGQLSAGSLLSELATAADISIGGSYAEVLQEVEADVALGRQLRVGGTPAYFLNGKRLPPTLSAVSLEAAIRFELRALSRSAVPLGQ